MGIITDIQQINRQQWQALVESSPTASWFQTPDAYDFYASLPEMMMPFVVAVTGERLRAVCVGFVTKEKSAIKQFFTSRAIIYGGPLLAADISDKEVKALLTEIKHLLRKKAIYVETRNLVELDAWNECFEAVGFVHKPHYDMHVDCSNRERMVSLVHDSKMRQIRKAQKDGVTISEGTTPEDVHDYYVLLRRLYRNKVRRPLFAEAFFQRFVADKRGILLVAKQNGAVIGGILCPLMADKVLYEWYIVGPAIVTWAAMEYANMHNLPLFDLLGAGEPDKPYGVRDFKQQFGGVIVKRGRYLLVNNKLLYSLGEFVVKNILDKRPL